MNISIINGPNLNLLGTREPLIYGDQTFEDYYKILKNRFPEIIFDYFQSNIEGEIINRLHQVGFSTARPPQSYAARTYNTLLLTLTLTLLTSTLLTLTLLTSLLTLTRVHHELWSTNR